MQGALLTIYDSGGLTSDAAPYNLPLTGWKRLGKPANPKGYVFRGKLVGGGPIQSVRITADTIRVKGKGIAYTLNEPMQGRVAVLLQSGSTGWCTDAPPKPKGDVPGLFVAAPKTPAPSSCPPTP